ncbi:ArnT family glycosyltransferase [Neobacillus sp. NPDC097160]|uniref:ArnT family glycosyltransferase n=1 Tax=Neobacillus sp. NPDC097160 TaxID=3364298 RepID=UPI00380EBC6A
MSKFTKVIKSGNQTKIIWFILLIGFLLRIAALYKYGLNLSLNSDDAGYTRSAIILLQKKMLIYHDVNTPTVHIMPGQPIMLALIFMLFGHGNIGIYAAKVVMIFLGIGSIYCIYLIGKYVFNSKIGLIAAFFMAIFIPQVLVDNLLLTESPFTLLSLFLIYYSIKLANEKKMIHFYWVISLYILAIYFRPTIALFPLVLLVYLLLKKYPFKLMVKQAIIAVFILLITLGPWWIRNYIQFHEFIPLSGGAGNPLLLGAYQGNIVPEESYQSVLDRIQAEHPHLDAYDDMKEQERIAKEEIKKMWHRDKKAFLYSYAYIKPKILWGSQFYWIEIFHIKSSWIQKINPLILAASFIGMMLSFVLFSKKWREYLFLLAFIVYFTVLNCIYLAYDRYNLPLMPFILLFVGVCIFSILNLFRKKELVK